MVVDLDCVGGGKLTIACRISVVAASNVELSFQRTVAPGNESLFYFITRDVTSGEVREAEYRLYSKQ